MVSSSKKVEKLLSVAKGRKKALIMPHDYADPDAIAAALALKTLLQGKLKLESTISFNGVVGRVENKALCDYLDIEIVPSQNIEFDDFDLIALVDCQPGAGNNSLPDHATPDIIIDHHPKEGRLEGVRFLDIRDDCGASSTIMVEYLLAAGVRIGKELATALLYGIKTDAMNFAIKTKERDIGAYHELFKSADIFALNRIESAGLPREYFKVLNEAIRDAGTYDNVLISDLGSVVNPGMIGEFADFFLRTEDVGVVLCFGVYNEKLLISMRSLEPKVNAGRIIRYAVGRRGTAGGHAAMAGGQIHLVEETRKEEQEHKKAVIGRVIERLGIEGKRKRKMVDVS
jgi:nanoRNase/pAp phosphatase (c-di-AMP/oligoRNAs hydrolase)